MADRLTNHPVSGTCAGCGKPDVKYRSQRRRFCGTCVNKIKAGARPIHHYDSDVCAVGSCENPRRSGPWCVAHGERVRKYGNPRDDRPVRERTGVILVTVPRATYRAIWNPGHPLARRDGYVFEHRMVAWDEGLLTDPAHHVHHVNHDQLDNRPENLEVVTDGEHRRRHAAEDGTTNQFGHNEPRAEECRLCGRPVGTGDLCVAHYTRLLRHGDPLVVTRVVKGVVAPYVLRKVT